MHQVSYNAGWHFQELSVNRKSFQLFETDLDQSLVLEYFQRYLNTRKCLIQRIRYVLDQFLRIFKAYRQVQVTITSELPRACTRTTTPLSTNVHNQPLIVSER
ncbi:hypothetical protein BK663_25355 [Pseudomonas lini]|uniref:Uncharacterized protein n=1 Tax=Pseudomonas lini TaxID=163011 RepID=A0A423IAF8_9PSED|nr:hypothetical protein BK663_25355 [Pseudomonas lini]